MQRLQKILALNFNLPNKYKANSNLSCILLCYYML